MNCLLKAYEQEADKHSKVVEAAATDQALKNAQDVGAHLANRFGTNSVAAEQARRLTKKKVNIKSRIDLRRAERDEIKSAGESLDESTGEDIEEAKK